MAANSDQKNQLMPGPQRMSVVRVRVGALDRAQARELRLLLRDLAYRPCTKLVLDLTHLDDRHVLTMFALLTEADRLIEDPRTEIVAVQPPPRLHGYLRPTHINVAPDALLPPTRACDLRLDFGSMDQGPCIERRLQQRAVCPFGATCTMTSLAPPA